MIALLPGCGLFGSKKEKSRVAAPQGDGCLNELSKKVERFFKGEIPEQEWVSTFDCVNDQVDFFERFVRPSSSVGYTEGDIGSLTRRFLITNQPVSDQFISAMFQLKASMVGGPVNIVTQAELKQFVELSHLLRRESLVLLPLIRNRVKNPTSESSLVLADALAEFGKKVGDHFETISGSIILHKDVLIPFARELIRLTGGNESIVDRYGEFVRNVKVASAGGDNNAIEPKAWASLIRDTTAFGGLYVSFYDRNRIRFGKDADESEFYLELVQRAERHANRILKRRGGSISLRELNQLIETAPTDGFSQEKRAALKSDLPNIVDRVLRGRNSGALDYNAIETLAGFFEEGMTGQIQLQKIFERIPNVVSVEAFEDAALRYAGTLGSDQRRQQVTTLISNAKLFIGLYPESGDIIRIAPEDRAVRTKNHLIRMNWFRLGFRHLLSVYGTGPGGSGQLKDLQRLTEDFENILRAMKKAHPTLTPEEMAQKRFREANLFMPNSNGDQYMSEYEGTYYLAFLFSAGSLAGEIYRTLVEERNLCPIVGRDDLGEPAMDANCFRAAYFGNVDTFWQPFPALLSAYKHMSPASQASLQRSMEAAARVGGISDKPIGRYDVDAFAGLPHFVEEVMDRFDVNQSQTLSKHEVFKKGTPKGAYSVFRGELRKFAGIKKEWLLQCAFSYLLKYGRQPVGTLQKAQLLAWCAWKPFWKLNADRGDLYKIIAMISASSNSGDSLAGFRAIESGQILDPEFSEATWKGIAIPPSKYPASSEEDELLEFTEQ